MYSILCSFRGAQYGIGTLVGVVANGTVLFSSTVTAQGQIVPFNTEVILAAGQTVVFSVGPGGGDQNTGLSATITGSQTSPLPLFITTTALPNATSGQPYSQTLAAAGGSGTGYTWCVQPGCVQSGSPLPAGFTLSSGGVLSSTGSPTASASSYTFTVQVTDSAGNLATQPLTVVIEPPLPPLQITSTTLLNATGGQPYSTALAATGGSGTGYTWSLSSGSLPAGFTLSPGGVLNSTGSPAASANLYIFTVQVTDSSGNLAQKAFTLLTTSPVAQACVSPPSGNLRVAV